MHVFPPLGLDLFIPLSLQGKYIGEAESSEPGANSQGLKQLVWKRERLTSATEMTRKALTYFCKWWPESVWISFSREFSFPPTCPLLLKSQLRVVSFCWSAYLSICVNSEREKKHIVQGGIEHVLIRTQSGLPSPQGWVCSAAGRHGAVCFVKSMWKSEQNRTENSLCVHQQTSNIHY